MSSRMQLSRNGDEISTKSGDPVQLGGLHFDTATRELRDAGGAVIELRRQSSDVLAELARRPGVTVAKEDLIRAIWGDVAVTDDSLVQCIADIRRVLGPEARNCVQTVPRRGYRMVPAPPGPSIGSRTWVPVGALVAVLFTVIFGGLATWHFASRPQAPAPAAPEAGRPTIMVLPFANLSGDPDQVYFSDGLTEDLTTDLSQLSGIRTISSMSSFTYRDSDRPPEAIARELGASHMVTGSVRRDGRRLRVSATLAEVTTGTNVWAHRYDRDIGGIFEVQSELARSISEALAIKLTADEELLFQRAQAVDPEAYDLLLRGLAPLRRITAEGIEEARRYFRRAIEIEPDYARAHANLALSYGEAVVFRMRDDQPNLDFALSEARRAVELNPNLPQAQFALAVVHLAARHHDGAISAARQAVLLDQSYSDGYAVLAQTLAYGGDLDEALAAIRKAKKLSPRYTFAYLWVEAHILFQQRRYKEARLLLEDVVARNPAFLVGQLTLAATYGYMGLDDDAGWAKAEILTMAPDLSATNEGRLAPYRNEADREHFVKGLLMAGLPE